MTIYVFQLAPSVFQLAQSVFQLAPSVFQLAPSVFQLAPFVFQLITWVTQWKRTQCSAFNMWNLFIQERTHRSQWWIASCMVIRPSPWHRTPPCVAMTLVAQSLWAINECSIKGDTPTTCSSNILHSTNLYLIGKIRQWSSLKC